MHRGRRIPEPTWDEEVGRVDFLPRHRRPRPFPEVHGAGEVRRRQGGGDPNLTGQILLAAHKEVALNFTRASGRRRVGRRPAPSRPAHCGAARPIPGAAGAAGGGGPYVTAGGPATSVARLAVGVVLVAHAWGAFHTGLGQRRS